MVIHKILPAILLAAMVLAGCTESRSRQIQVSGTATVKARPELVVFDFMIEERGQLLSPLKSRIDSKATALVKLCKRLGIQPKDLTSAEISIQPQYHYNTGRFTGYHVSRTVTARLYDLSNYSKVIDGAVKTGITTIQNISLQMKPDNNLENRALVKAVDDGTAKAILLAGRGQVRLGKILQVTESGPGFPVQSGYRAKKLARDDVALEAAPYVFEPGQLSVSKTVHLVFDID